MRASALAGNSIAALFALALGTSGAAAGCDGCYRKVYTPATYATVSQQVLLQPGRVVAHEIPAEYAEVTERVLVRPARIVPYATPAITQTVVEQVLVAPPRREWRVTADAYGQEIGCWVTTPAAYATRYHDVVVQPASTRFETIPAVYQAVSRAALVRPASVQHEVIPPVFGTTSRQVLVSPGSAAWQPVGGPVDY